MTQNVPAMFAMSDLERMAQAIVKSSLFGIKTIDQAVTLMLVAQAEGMHPATAARDYHIIQNRPAMKADAMLARFQQAGGTVEWMDYTDTKVSGRFSHPQSPKPVLIEWTLDMAKRIGLAAKDNWRNYPRQMLRARVVSEGVRTCFPAIATGIYTPEEVQDFGEKDVTPTAGVLGSLSAERQEIINETAAQVRASLAEDSAWDAYSAIENSGFDSDERAALWSLLNSKQRSALKRMKEAEDAQIKGTISEPQKKRLEALIKERKLDRDEVKSYCQREFGVLHFKDLDGAQYQALSAYIEPTAAAPVTTGEAEKHSPVPTAATPALIDDKQESELLDHLEAAGISIKAFLKSANIGKIRELQAARLAGAIQWIKSQAQP